MEDRPAGVNIWKEMKLKPGQTVYKRGKYLDNLSTGGFDIIIQDLNIANHNTRAVCEITEETTIYNVIKKHYDEFKWFREGIMRNGRMLYSHKDIIYLIDEASKELK